MRGAKKRWGERRIDFVGDGGMGGSRRCSVHLGLGCGRLRFSFVLMGGDALDVEPWEDEL